VGSPWLVLRNCGQVPETIQLVKGFRLTLSSKKDAYYIPHLGVVHVQQVNSGGCASIGKLSLQTQRASTLGNAARLRKCLDIKLLMSSSIWLMAA